MAEKAIQIAIDPERAILMVLTDAGNIYRKPYPSTTSAVGYISLPTGVTATEVAGGSQVTA